jgi:hypothetical protein
MSGPPGNVMIIGLQEYLITGKTKPAFDNSCQFVWERIGCQFVYKKLF